MKNRLIVTVLIGTLVNILGCEPFLERSISNKQIVLNAPQDSDSITGQVNFWWNELEFAPKYRLQIVSPNFTAPSLFLLDTVVSSYSYQTSLPSGIYQWRVRGENGNSETPYSTRTLYIVNSQDLTTQSVILKSPVNGAAYKDSIINFSWYNIATATGYNFQITDSSGGVLYEHPVSGDSINRLTTSEGYFKWRVKGLNATTETVYSERAFYYDKTAPNQPAISLPQYGDTVNTGTILLQWSRGIENGSPITDSIFVYSDSLNTLSGIYFSAIPSYSLTVGPGIYYWRVRPVDKAGNVGAYSTPFKFKAQ